MQFTLPLRSMLACLMFCMAVAALVCHKGFNAGVAAQNTQLVVAVDATSTFLRAESFDKPTLPRIIPLAASGLNPGDEIKLSYAVNGFKYGSYCDPGAPTVGAAGIFLLGVFSNSNQLDAQNVLRRVPGAIGAGLSYARPPADDIPEDYRIEPGSTSVKIPAGATHLFLGIADSFYADNCGQLNVTIERTGSQSPSCSSQSADLDAKASFLRAAEFDGPGAPRIVSLADIGLAPGDDVKLSYEVNGFKYGSYCDPAAPVVDAAGVVLLGLFSRSNQLEPASVLRRVPGAIDAGRPYVGPMDNDIPEDFRIAPGSTTIRIPGGATHLFLGIADSFYADNCGTLKLKVERGTTQLSIPATTHGFSGDIYPLASPFGMALTSTSGGGFNTFAINPTTFGGTVTDIGGLPGLQPQGLAYSTPGGKLSGLSCLDSVWDFTFEVASAGNTIGDTVTLFLQNPDGTGVLTLAVFTIEAGGARVTSLHPAARFYVNNRLANIPPTGVNALLPFSISAGTAGARTVPLLMSLPMDPGSIFMDCRQLGFSVMRSSGTGTLSLVFADIVLVRKEMTGDRNRPGVGLIFGLGGGYPTGAPCAVTCPGCLQLARALQFVEEK